MIPIMKSRYLREQNSESSEHEESLPAPSTSSSGDSNPSVDPTSSVCSTSTVDSNSADDLAECQVIVVDLTSSASSARVDDLTSPMPSTSSMPPTFPIQTPPDHPIPPVPSTSRGIQENYDDFRFEAARRASFLNWPVSFIDPVSLAAAGLYYTGETDIVRCFECQLVISHWSEGHTPMQIHRMYSPECKFVRNEHCNNVPIGVDPDKFLRTKRNNRNRSWPYQEQQHQESFDFNDRRSSISVRNPTAYERSHLRLKGVKKPENLDYSSYQSRLNSFVTWPTYMTQTSKLLADAGFFYTGINDITTCHHCGIDIGNWRPELDPWEQHAISSPRCSYLLKVRGWEYIDNVTRQKLHETSVEEPIESKNETNEINLVEEIAALERKNQKLKDSRLCKVCTEREATITYLPCGHLATCHYCSPNFGQCIICRKEIKAAVRVTFA